MTAPAGRVESGPDGINIAKPGRKLVLLVVDQSFAIRTADSGRPHVMAVRQPRMSMLWQGNTFDQLPRQMMLWRQHVGIQLAFALISLCDETLSNSLK
jgi:hypothetical protein